MSPEQWKPLSLFHQRMKAAILNRQNDEEIAPYAEILKWCLTPAKGDDPQWQVFFSDEVELFIGTRYGPEFVPLLLPIVRSYPNDSVRVMTAYTMAELGDHEHVADVLPLLASPNETTRRVAHRVLNMMGYHVPSPIHDDETPERNHATKILRNSGSASGPRSQ